MLKTVRTEEPEMGRITSDQLTGLMLVGTVRRHLTIPVDVGLIAFRSSLSVFLRSSSQVSAGELDLDPMLIKGSCISWIRNALYGRPLLDKRPRLLMLYASSHRHTTVRSTNPVQRQLATPMQRL